MFGLTIPQNFSMQRKKIVTVISFTILILLAALRSPEVGTDTANYVFGYNKIANQNFSGIFDVVRWEEGYVLLNKIISIIFNNEQALIIITSLLCTGLIFLFVYKYSVNTVFSIYLYISLFYYFASFNIIRQYLAIGIILLAYKFILERKFFKYLLLILLAASFHQLALLLLPIYFLYGMKLNKRNVLLLTLGSIILIYGFEKIIQLAFRIFPTYQGYVDTNLFEGGGLLTSLISFSVLAFGLYIKITNNIKEKEFDFLLVLVFLSFIVALLSMQASIFNRVGYYLNIFYITFIPLAVSKVREVKLKTIYVYIVFCFTFLYFIVRLIEGWHGILPYQFFFEL